MTQEDKQLLLKDLCPRLPYKVKGVYARTDIKNLSICELTAHIYGEMEESFNEKEKYEFIPYLRSLSSMTEDEYENLCNSCTWLWFKDDLRTVTHGDYKCYDWLNEHHFDFRGLIDKGLAIEATEGMYKTE